jgi:hypothetical protein
METIVVDHKSTIQVHLRAIITDQAEGVPATPFDVKLASPAHDKVVTTASLPAAARRSNVDVPVIGNFVRPPVAHVWQMAQATSVEELTFESCTAIAATTAAWLAANRCAADG